ncbi:hypothetical protein Sste5346_008338 [Sporothrix stenoceras]|uniref:Ig-like domain-containing protein n=1 Tax=Sporothrix stenoceras TaxID=5173 RepID=A0ABR3YR14_9PEZI
MKVPQLSGLVACALLCASPADAAKCRLSTPSSSISSAASVPSGPSTPNCYTNYISNKYFTDGSSWTFAGDSSASTSCGIYSTCAELNADAGPASVSQSFATVPGFQYYASFAYMYSSQPASDADSATCEIISGGQTVASVVLPYRGLSTYYGQGVYATPTTRTSTLICKISSASTGPVYLTQMAVTWNSDTCEN